MFCYLLPDRRGKNREVGNILRIAEGPTSALCHKDVINGQQRCPSVVGPCRWFATSKRCSWSGKKGADVPSWLRRRHWGNRWGQLTGAATVETLMYKNLNSYLFHSVHVKRHIVAIIPVRHVLNLQPVHRLITFADETHRHCVLAGLMLVPVLYTAAQSWVSRVHGNGQAHSSKRHQWCWEWCFWCGLTGVSHRDVLRPSRLNFPLNFQKVMDLHTQMWCPPRHW